MYETVLEALLRFKDPSSDEVNLFRELYPLELHKTLPLTRPKLEMKDIFEEYNDNRYFHKMHAVLDILHLIYIKDSSKPPHMSSLIFVRQKYIRMLLTGMIETMRKSGIDSDVVFLQFVVLMIKSFVQDRVVRTMANGVDERDVIVSLLKEASGYVK